MKLNRSALAWGLVVLAAAPALAQTGITFQNIADDADAGLTYSRVFSARNARQEAIQQDGIMQVPDEYVVAPVKPRGAPGVALLDYDRDGDLDAYVTNGPGAANSLFTNQLRQTGVLSFVDRAAAAGVDATSQDSQGVCHGDIDNDGDPDLLVLGSSEPNRLFENQGDGTFRDITVESHVGAASDNSTSCSMGDVNGDGRLDLFIANTFDFTTQETFAFGVPTFSQHNQLLINQGSNTFTDTTAASGLRELAQLSVPDSALPTWAGSLVDFDLDGDLDVVAAQDERALFPEGFIRFFRNDGTGRFTDATFEVGMNRTGSWRGLSFGDLNCDGRLDLFATNIGDYIFGPGGPVGDKASRWFLGQANGTFADPGPGALATIPTGWGTSTADYDNDGDLDIVLHGGQDLPLFWDATNPGIVLRNEGCSARFTWDAAALAATDHTRRNVEGMAMGDLNNDGFVDLVSVASFDIPEEMPLLPLLFSGPLGSVFDATAPFAPDFAPSDDPDQFLWLGIRPLPGSLAVEISSGGNGNRWVDVDVVGTVGITDRGRVNRDGIGAVVSFTPAPGTPGTTVLKPVVGGSSYASQDSLTAHFGLGRAPRGTVEVRWPGGVRNRLYGVRAGERVVFPEIPCSFDGGFRNQGPYVTCVLRELERLRDAGVIDRAAELRFFLSALRAYQDENH